jgi:hypothetical protein
VYVRARAHTHTTCHTQTHRHQRALEVPCPALHYCALHYCARRQPLSFPIPLGPSWQAGPAAVSSSQGSGPARHYCHPSNPCCCALVARQNLGQAQAPPIHSARLDLACSAALARSPGGAYSAGSSYYPPLLDRHCHRCCCCDCLFEMLARLDPACQINPQSPLLWCLSKRNRIFFFIS